MRPILIGADRISLIIYTVAELYAICFSLTINRKSEV